MKTNAHESAASEPVAPITEVADVWPICSLTPRDDWWITGSAALALHFNAWWRPIGDIDVTLNRTDNVTRLIDERSPSEPRWTQSLRGWYEQSDDWSQQSLELVRPQRLPVSFRTVDVASGYWWSAARPELVVPSTDAIVLNTPSVPYLAPELVLLSKSRQGRLKDRDDFYRATGLLEPARLRRLVEWLPAQHRWRSAVLEAIKKKA